MASFHQDLAVRFGAEVLWRVTVSYFRPFHYSWPFQEQLMWQLRVCVAKHQVSIICLMLLERWVVIYFFLFFFFLPSSISMLLCTALCSLGVHHVDIGGLELPRCISLADFPWSPCAMLSRAACRQTPKSSCIPRSGQILSQNQNRNYDSLCYIMTHCNKDYNS